MRTKEPCLRHDWVTGHRRGRALRLRLACACAISCASAAPAAVAPAAVAPTAAPTASGTTNDSCLASYDPAREPDHRLVLDAIYCLLGHGRIPEAQELWNAVAERLQRSLPAPDGPRAAEAARRTAELVFVQGLLTARVGHKDEALGLLREADGRGFPPLDSPLLLLAADALRELQEPALAAQAYQAFLQKAPANLGALLGLGVAFYQSGRLAQAEAALEEVLRRAPGTPQASYYLGAALFEQKRSDDARPHLERELKRDPRCYGCMAKLAHIAYLAGDDGECERWLARAAALEPDYLETSLVSGMLALRRGRYAQAIQRLSLVVQKSPGYARAQYQLALAYQRAGNGERARAHFEIYDRLVQEEKARSLGVRGAPGR